MLYAVRLAHGRVDLAFTDRYGGVSAAPFDELNLALASADDPSAVAENHRRVLADFAPGARVADMSQVHGAEVARVPDLPGAADPGDVSASRPRCDALVSTASDVVLVVRAADCVPVLLADARAGVIGVAHAGRAGLVAGVAPAAVRRMRELGAGQVRAWFGPRVCGGCYEVPAQLRADVADVEPASAATTTWGSPALDIGAGVRAQLERADVEVSDVGACTRESPSLYSYRRDGERSGRIAGLVRLRAAGSERDGADR